MTALETFRIIAQEFSGIPDDNTTDGNGKTVVGVNTYMDLWKDQISKRRFGSMYEKALAYLTAHKLKMMNMESPDGSSEMSSSMKIGSVADQLRIASASEGDTSVSFNNNVVKTEDADSEYLLTVYGIEFLTLKRLAVIPIVSAGEPIRNAPGGY